ncbi:MAG: hypothetical protein HY040_19710 [Planctomycetes bacterium]|nr:hypothetical protein [Planctomycetota bacterium]
MADVQLNLTTEERDCLTTLLDMALKDARIEEHRTKTPSFREHVIHREELLQAVLKKLGSSK